MDFWKNILEKKDELVLLEAKYFLRYTDLSFENNTKLIKITLQPLKNTTGNACFLLVLLQCIIHIYDTLFFNSDDVEGYEIDFLKRTYRSVETPIDEKDVPKIVEFFSDTIDKITFKDLVSSSPSSDKESLMTESFQDSIYKLGKNLDVDISIQEDTLFLIGKFADVYPWIFTITEISFSYLDKIWKINTENQSHIIDKNITVVDFGANKLEQNMGFLDFLTSIKPSNNKIFIEEKLDMKGALKYTIFEISSPFLMIFNNRTVFDHSSKRGVYDNRHIDVYMKIKNYMLSMVFIKYGSADRGHYYVYRFIWNTKNTFIIVELNDSTITYIDDYESIKNKIFTEGIIFMYTREDINIVLDEDKKIDLYDITSRDKTKFFGKTKEELLDEFVSLVKN
jgi:hypothetical protein